LFLVGALTFSYVLKSFCTAKEKYQQRENITYRLGKYLQVTDMTSNQSPKFIKNSYDLMVGKSIHQENEN
jgi:hypothetical protein